MSDLLDMRAEVAPRWRDTAGRFQNADEAVDRALYDMGQVWGTRAVRRLQAATPVGKKARYGVPTGTTRASWRANYLPSQRAVKVSNKRPAATFLIQGTRPHNIPGAFGRGYNKGREEEGRFGVGGRFEGMFHPGQQPNEDLVGALERVQEDAQTDFSDAGAALVRRLMTGL